MADYKGRLGVDMRASRRRVSGRHADEHPSIISPRAGSASI
jgi:hypothetical protein